MHIFSQGFTRAEKKGRGGKKREAKPKKKVRGG